MELEGKVAFITGASSGIGEATSRELAAAGVRVALMARRGDRLEKLKTAIEAGGGEVLVLCADVTKKGGRGLPQYIRQYQLPHQQRGRHAPVADEKPS